MIYGPFLSIICCYKSSDLLFRKPIHFLSLNFVEFNFLLTVGCSIDQDSEIV